MFSGADSDFKFTRGESGKGLKSKKERGRGGQRQMKENSGKEGRKRDKTTEDIEAKLQE